MHGTITGEDNLLEGQKILQGWNLTFSGIYLLRCVAVDGGKHMAGLKGSAVADHV